MNILAIGAHFDDIELGCGGALSRHVKHGDNVFVFVATLSGYTDPYNKTVRKNDVALAEGQNAIEVLGVKELVLGSSKTLHVEFTDTLNVEILKVLDKHKIDRVYSHWDGDIHHDHIAVSKSTLHTCRHIGQILMYRSNWYQSSQDFRGNFFVDISEHWEVKKQSVMCHKSELERTGYKWISFFENEALNSGQKIGVKYAEVFQVLKFCE
ncbi:PIG-L family deacetylase [Alphaproteobacteria bacterium]|nr:PIG-L family deacetylase [Alphaproteobacteria bacterium]